MKTTDNILKNNINKYHKVIGKLYKRTLTDRTIYVIFRNTDTNKDKNMHRITDRFFIEVKES